MAKQGSIRGGVDVLTGGPNLGSDTPSRRPYETSVMLFLLSLRFAPFFARLKFVFYTPGRLLTKDLPFCLTQTTITAITRRRVLYESRYQGVIFVSCPVFPMAFPLSVCQKLENLPHDAFSGLFLLLPWIPFARVRKVRSLAYSLSFPSSSAMRSYPPCPSATVLSCLTSILHSFPSVMKVFFPPPTLPSR